MFGKYWLLHDSNCDPTLSTHLIHVDFDFMLLNDYTESDHFLYFSYVQLLTY